MSFRQSTRTSSCVALSKYISSAGSTLTVTRRPASSFSSSVRSGISSILDFGSVRISRVHAHVVNLRMELRAFFVSNPLLTHRVTIKSRADTAMRVRFSLRTVSGEPFRTVSVRDRNSNLIGGVSCDKQITNNSTNSHFFETMSKRRKGSKRIEQGPPETQFKRGERIVHGDKLLEEKLGRNDLCPCGSGQRFKKCCLTKGCF